MKISDLFGRVGVQNSNRSAGAQKAEERDEQIRARGEDGSDRTSISTKARLLSQVAAIRDDEENTRAKRVQDIKRRVEAGEYNVSSKDVAEKIDEFFSGNA